MKILIKLIAYTFLVVVLVAIISAVVTTPLVSPNDPLSYSRYVVEPKVEKFLKDQDNIPVNATFNWLQITAPTPQSDGTALVTFRVQVQVPSKDSRIVVGTVNIDAKEHYVISTTAD